jgi:hypothetical protein
MTRATRGSGRDALHLAVLTSLCVAQPLFDVLGPAPGFFAAHRIGSLGVIAFALALVVVPPLVLAAVELVAGLAGERVRRTVHLVFVAGLVALLALEVVRSLSSAAALAAAAIAGAGAAALYARWWPARAFFTALAPAPLVFLALFLFASPASKLVLGASDDAWTAKKSYRPPIVFLQFDALNSLLLHTPGHEVDRVRYPNFARLARDGAWYRNASNVHENTVFSVPSIVDGNLPRKGTHPVVADHPQSLFTVLGPEYRMHVAEEATSLCPNEYCRARPERWGRARRLFDDVRVVFNHIWRPESMRTSLPRVDTRWTGFATSRAPHLTSRIKSAEYIIRHLQSGRIGRFERWLAGVAAGTDRPQLSYIHIFLPHEPREFIPDGRRYVTPDQALGGTPSYDERFLSGQDEQRDLLQLGFADRVLGKVLARLDRMGIYDRAMIVAVADHGESFDVSPRPAPPFQRGHLGFRRAATERNLEDIASIPLFVKYPQGHGPRGADDRYVRDIDVLPTISDVTGVRLRQRVDGSSLLARGYGGHDTIYEGTTFGAPIVVGAERWQARRRQSLERRLRMFGWGTQSLYRFGPRPDLVGQRVAALRVVPARGARATVYGAGRFADVNPGSPVCLCQIAGRVSREVRPGQPLAIVLNGQIAATAETFEAIGAKRLEWAAMLPPDKFREGHNTLQVFAIEGNALRRLA